MAKKKGSSNHVIDVDFDDYDATQESQGGYYGEEPRRGLYRFKLVSVGWYTADNGNESIRWIFRMLDEPYAGWNGYRYTNMEAARSQTQQIMRALQNGQEKPVRLDLDDEKAVAKFIKKAVEVRGAVRTEEYNGEIRGKLVAVMPLNETEHLAKKNNKKVDEDEDDDFEDSEDEELEEDEDEDEDFEEDEGSDEDEDDDDDDDDDDEDEDEEEEEPAPPVKAKKKKAAPAPAKKPAKAKKK